MMKTLVLFWLNFYCVYVFGQDCHASPNNVDPDDCCKTPMMIPMEILTECLTKYGEMRKKQLELPGPKRGCCIGDCITDKMGVNPTANGNLDRESFNAYLQKALQGSDSTTWMDALNIAVDRCFKVADTKAGEWNEAFALPPGFEGDKVCHPISGETLACVFNEVYLNCPSSVYKQSAECDEIKVFVQKCNIIPRHGV